MESLEAIGLVLSVAAAWLAVTLLMLTRIHRPATARRRRTVAVPPREAVKPPAPKSFRALAAASKRPVSSASANYPPVWRRRTQSRTAAGRTEREDSLAS
ncbi:hypothetical protein [Arthrobacter silvisoli]|uniref:hypothetical protein n=1 Tax=Arthrobacter silvisoli TaxID=2291022 RepID=UPI000E212FE7|nr:hypothetical protein [Arthrobacter silvisoli]